MARYSVMVDDNYHYMDESERYQQGEYATLEEAVAVCKEIVDTFLESAYKPGMSVGELYTLYTGFGEDPFILGPQSGVLFSAWEYARWRCEEIVKRSS